MTPAPALCVYCRERPVDPKWRPFCSDRCRLLDLARWVTGDYRVAGEPSEDRPADDEESGAQPWDPDRTP